MTAFNVEFINPFLTAATKILNEMCQIETKLGRPVIKEPVFGENSLVIMIGVTGEMKGQVMISFTLDIACEIASKMMMGMPVPELNELAKSAICELGNMILGNTATIFSTKGIGIDITPPTLVFGNMSFSHTFAKNICVPIIYEENKGIEINIAMKQE
ncbi:MAG: hypothetical protein K0R15_2000 [Clostridiales bacterium]|jgi:chemotaxis protein CheX|nr:hypothetical protein [Clostridiales bacterium]